MTLEIYALSFGFIVSLSLIIVFIIKLKLLPKKFSYPGLFFLVFLASILTILSRPNASELGLAVPSRISMFFYSGITAISCIFIFLMNKYTYKQKTINIFKLSQLKILFYVLLSAPIQEFLFRSFLYYSLSKINMLTILSMTVFSSFLFGTAHMGFENKYLTRGTFILGVVWGIMFFLIPDLFLISVSHAIIGLFALSQGLIKKETFFLETV